MNKTRRHTVFWNGLKLFSGLLIVFVCVASSNGDETSAVPAGQAGVDSVTVVNKDTVDTVIVIADDATDTVARLAEQLRDFIQQTIGVDLSIVKVSQLSKNESKVTPLLICVGPSRLTEDLVDTLPDDPYAAGGQDAIVRYEDRRVMLTGSRALKSMTTRYAVRELLMRWGLKSYRGSDRRGNDNRLYTIVPRSSQLTIPVNLRTRVRTAFLARSPNATVEPILSSGGGVPWEVAHNWGGIHEAGDFESHPEYFAFRDGKRNPGRPCTSHPVILDRLVEIAARGFATGKRVFSLTPPDGTRYLCECESCADNYNKLEKTSDRFILLANTVRALLDEKYPQFHDRFIHILAGYGWEENRFPPSPAVEALPGVVLWIAHQGCHAHHWSDPECPLNRTFAEQMRGWIAATRHPIGVYDYACYSNYRWDRKWASFPVVSVRRVVKDVKAYQRAGVGYIYFEAEATWPRYVPFRWINAYAIEQALADPHIDADALLHTLCEDLYGPASKTMYEYYDLLQTRLDETSLHAGNWYLPDPAMVYNSDDVKRLTGLVKQAVWEAQDVGGDVLQRCLESQKVWYQAVASLSDEDREQNGPKEFNELPWP